MRHFLFELLKLIISSGLAKLCQELEPAAKAQARPGLSLLPILTPPSMKLCSGRIGGTGCLSWLSLAWHTATGAFACSGVLIKSFIVLHSRKELRRNNWVGQNWGEERMWEGRKERRKERRGGREREMRSLFSLYLLVFLYFKKMFDLVCVEM